MTSNRRVDVYVRTFEPFKDEHESAVERLQQLAREGTIAAVEVQTWPEKVRLSERTICREVLDLYDRFDAWANETGVSIHPPFEVHETGYELLGERDETLILPVICVAVWEDDDLVGVYPNVGDAGSVGLEDCLEALEENRELPS